MAVEEKTLSGRSLVKDFHRLMRNIDSMSGGQARLVGWDEADLNNGITVSVIPDDGLYKDGEFLFKIVCKKYPNKAPGVYCETMIYHPNIEDGDICLNLLNDENWSSSMTLEDVVQGILFLMYNPNLEDPLSFFIRFGTDEDKFADNVRQSLEGGLVDSLEFPRNRVIKDDGGVIKEVSGTCADNVGGATTEGGATIWDVGMAMEGKETVVNCCEEDLSRGISDNLRPIIHDVAENKDRRTTPELRKIGPFDKNDTEKENGFHWDGLRKKIFQDLFYFKEAWWFSW